MAVSLSLIFAFLALFIKMSMQGGISFDRVRNLTKMYFYRQNVCDFQTTLNLYMY